MFFIDAGGNMGLTEILDVAKYFVPLVGGVIVWFFNKKNNSQLNRLALLDKSKSLISEDKYKYLEDKISNEILASEIKIQNDGYFDFGVFLISNKVLNGIQYRTLKKYLFIKNKKIKFNVGSGYLLDFIVSRVIAVLFLFLAILYVSITAVALHFLITDVSSKDIYEVFVGSIKFSVLFLSSIFLFFIVNLIFKMNPSVRSVIFMNVQLKKLKIPLKISSDLNLIIKRKRLTKKVRY